MAAVRVAEPQLVVLARRVGVEMLLPMQHGLIRRDQARAAGMSDARIDDLLRRRVWARVLPGVYAVDADPCSTMTRIRAAWLWAGEDSVVGGSAAAWWHGLTTGMPSVVEVFVPPHRSRRPQFGVRLIRGEVPESDRTSARGIRLTTVPRTCLDLARWNQNDLLDVALRIRKLTPLELPPSLNRSRRRRGQVRAKRIAAAAIRNPWSKSELLAQRLLTEAGITGWIANPRVSSALGEVYPDIAFEAVKVGIEIDGRRFHDEAIDPEAFEKDHQRQLALARAGWMIIRVTVRQLLEQADLVIATIRSVITERLAAA
jgi:very-short-patch-repair endonuclease